MRMLVRSLVVLALVMVAFSLHTVLHLDPSMVAMMGAGATVLVSRTEPEEFLEEVEWGTLAFFMALFVLVGSLVQVGVIGRIGEAAAAALGDRELLASTVLLFGSGVVGAFVDNIPYTTATVPVVEEMVAATATTGADSPLWWAFVFGADLGGNATAVAAGANVVVLGIAAKAGEPISFWQFTRYGVVVTVATLLVSWLYVYLRYFVAGLTPSGSSALSLEPDRFAASRAAPDGCDGKASGAKPDWGVCRASATQPSAPIYGPRSSGKSVRSRLSPARGSARTRARRRARPRRPAAPGRGR